MADFPFFLVGVDRSGTTLLSAMLQAHSRIAIPYESHFIIPYYQRREDFGDLSNLQNRKRLIESILREHYVRSWVPRVSVEDVDLGQCDDLASAIAEVYRAYAAKCGKDLWGDKTPSYVTHIYALHRLYPRAKYVHIIRDGRDVAMSIVRQWWGANNFLSAIRYWQSCITLATRQLRMLPDNQFVEVRFEDLVDRPKAELERICDLLGITVEERMLNEYGRIWDTLHPRYRAIHPKLGGPLSKEQCFKWKRHLSKADQAIAYEVAGETLAALGYETGCTGHLLRIPRKVYHRLNESVKWRGARAIRRLRREKTGVDREEPGYKGNIAIGR